jgi:hypothetical protein
MQIRLVAAVKRAALDLSAFAAAVFLPLGLTALILWRAGVIGQAWFWVVTYGRYDGSLFTLSRGAYVLSLTLPLLLRNTWPIWLLAIFGLVLQVRARSRNALFLAVFLAVSVAAVCPGRYFRGHYFVLMLPALALLAGSLTSLTTHSDSATKRASFLSSAAGMWLVVAALAIALIGQQAYLFQGSPVEVSRAVYAGNPFVETEVIGEYLKNHSNVNDEVAVLGSEPEIYFYAKRRSAVPYVYVYSLVENQPLAARMQDEFIAAIERTAPEYLVMVNVGVSWLAQADSVRRIFDWAPSYQLANYEPVGLADMLPAGTVYYWDADARQAKPKSQSFMVVFKRKKDRGAG